MGGAATAHGDVKVELFHGLKEKDEDCGFDSAIGVSDQLFFNSQIIAKFSNGVGLDQDAANEWRGPHQLLVNLHQVNFNILVCTDFHTIQRIFLVIALDWEKRMSHAAHFHMFINSIKVMGVSVYLMNFREEIWIDRYEYSEQHFVGCLTSVPPSYVGHKEGGQIAEVRRRLSYIVTLVLVKEDHQSEFMFAGFLSEFLIPLDDRYICFIPLSHDMLRVTKLQVKDASTRLAERIVALDLRDAAWDNVLPQSYDPTHGARPIRKYLEKRVGTLQYKMPLWNDKDKNSTVLVDAAFGGNGLRYQMEEKGDHAKTLNDQNHHKALVQYMYPFMFVIGEW
ncbi:hypothetical protein QQ045_001174 [Rhodiola kirilowii]